MGNTYFQFKQFRVEQEKAAMKVCTDACVFGTFVAQKEKNMGKEGKKILDIGTGTGLLSLMIAQKVEGNIEAVEIDEKAFEQAKVNFERSPWSDRLSAYHADITKFRFEKKFDIIVSNPPFFEQSLRSKDNSKNIAKHTSSLPYSKLASLVSTNLSNNGKFYILLPFSEFLAFQALATQNNLILTERLNLKQNENSGFFRTIGVFETKQTKESISDKSLSIKNTDNVYTKEFIALLKDYYLYF